jgi:hypothetical protein
MHIQTSSRWSDSLHLSLDSWVFRSSSATEVDSMIISHDPDDCDTNVNRQEKSLLMSLPVELLLLVAKFLEINDAASFTLSCKRAMCAVGLSSWKFIGRGCRYKSQALQRTRWKFLQALEKDLPNHHLCHFAEIFLNMSHKNHSPHSSNFEPNLDSCRRSDLSKLSESYSPYIRIATRLSFCDVQSILKAASTENASENSLNYLSFSRSWSNTMSWRHGHDVFLLRQDEKPLILNNELYIHTCSRRWALCSAEDIRDKKYRPQFFYDMSICRHQSLDMQENSINKLIRNSIVESSEEDVNYSELQPLVSLPFGCYQCPIECRYTVFNHGPKSGIELALEVGHILGSVSGFHDLEWSSRGAPEWKRYSFEVEKRTLSAYRPDPYPPSTRRDFSLQRMVEIEKPFILNEPGKVLDLLCPDGIGNTFDPEALRLAHEQRKAMKHHARKQSEQSQIVQEREGSRWQRLGRMWSKRWNSANASADGEVGDFNPESNR